MALVKSPRTSLISSVRESTRVPWYFFNPSRSPFWIEMKAFSVKFDHSIALIRRVIYAGSTSIHLALAMVVLSLSDLAAISLRDYLIVSITSYK